MEGGGRGCIPYGGWGRLLGTGHCELGSRYWNQLCEDLGLEHSKKREQQMQKPPERESHLICLKKREKDRGLEKRGGRETSKSRGQEGSRDRLLGLTGPGKEFAALLPGWLGSYSLL